MTETALILTLGERLLIARRRAGLTSAEMARRLRVVPNTIRSWETDRTTPGYLATIAWADECDVSPDVIDPDIRNRCTDPAPGHDVTAVAS